MVDLDNYTGPIKFGDEEIISAINSKKVRDLEKTKVTIDMRKLMKLGFDKYQSLNLIERIINLKK